MSPTIANALAAPPDSTSLRILGRVAPGLDQTRRQIRDYSDIWRSHADDALSADGRASDQPLIVALGDSLTQGIGATDPARSYVGQLRSALSERDEIPWSVINLARSGARIADVLDTQLPALGEVSQLRSGRAPDIIVCTVGSNDLMHSFRVGVIRKRMTNLVEALPSHSVLATLPDTSAMMPKMLNRHLRSVAAANDLRVADVASRLTSWRGRTAGDRFHPNDQGYEAWTDAFMETLGLP